MRLLSKYIVHYCIILLTLMCIWKFLLLMNFDFLTFHANFQSILHANFLNVLHRNVLKLYQISNVNEIWFCERLSC